MFNGELLRAERKAMGLSQDRLAKMVGVSQQLIGQLERGDLDSTTHVFKIAEVLKIPAHQLDDTIPRTASLLDRVFVVGHINGNNEVHLFNPAGNKGNVVLLRKFVPVSPHLGKTESTAALEIQSEGPGSFYNGWYVHFDQVHLKPDDEFLGKIAVMQIKNGPLVMRRAIKGSEPNRYTLVSVSGSLVENVEVEWYSPVRGMAQPIN